MQGAPQTFRFAPSPPRLPARAPPVHEATGGHGFARAPCPTHFKSSQKFVWKKATKTNRDKLDRKVKAILVEAERELNMELSEGTAEVITPDEMTRRTDDILAQMDASKKTDLGYEYTVSTTVAIAHNIK